MIQWILRSLSPSEQFHWPGFRRSDMPRNPINVNAKLSRLEISWDPIMHKILQKMSNFSERDSKMFKSIKRTWFSLVRLIGWYRALQEWQRRQRCNMWKHHGKYQSMYRFPSKSRSKNWPFSHRIVNRKLQYRNTYLGDCGYNSAKNL